MRSLARTASYLTIIALSLLPLAALAQTQDPLIGLWNTSGSLSDGSLAFIAMMNFNAGGTTVETDTGGGNSSAIESINLGTWQNTGTRKYTFKNQNYVYDSSGKLAYVNINRCKATLDSSLNKFAGKCNFFLYTCSVASCRGSLVAGPLPSTISGTRF